MEIKFRFGTQEKYNNSGLLMGELGFTTDTGRLYYGASDNNVHLIGENLTKLTVGQGNTINDSSVALGNNCNITHSNTIAIGSGLESSSESQIVLGKYNAENDSALFVVGGGDSTNRRNVFWADAYGVQVCGNDKKDGEYTGYVRNIHYGSEMPEDNVGNIGDVYLYIGE